MRLQIKSLVILLATVAFTVATVSLARAGNPGKCQSTTNPKCDVYSPSQ